jgi:hypothetical protein
MTDDRIDQIFLKLTASVRALIDELASDLRFDILRYRELEIAVMECQEKVGKTEEQVFVTCLLMLTSAACFQCQ